MMPKTSGMELLQIVREKYPELEVVMITGYASIESAVKAVKAGAAGYLPKPFTPEELTSVTEKALADRKRRLARRETVAKGRGDALQQDDGLLDVDLPFSAKELEQATSAEYVNALTHSDVPLAKKVAEKVYCHTGKRDCRRVVTEGKECVGECPILKKEKARASKGKIHVVRPTVDLIDVDLPFSIGEVEQVTGAEYISCLDRSDIPRAALYGRGTQAKHSVLVVDDEPIVCHSVRRILSKQSCAVEEAFDVDVALRKMKLNRYDLVILDLKMPKRSGIEVLESIRKHYPDVPVMMVSGHASIENAIEATRLGAFNFVAKPFTPGELVKVAEEALAA
jgi:DNA-binding response OmpR family regulator